MKDIHAQRILILDFGSQYTQIIGRRIRDIGVFCEIHPWHMESEKIKAFKPSGIILSGGPESVIESENVRAPEIVFQLGCPLLGICYGLQTMAVQLGGQVEQGKLREFGYTEVKLKNRSPLLDGIEDHVGKEGSFIDVWMSHGDHVSVLPPDFSIIASSESCDIIGMADVKRQWYGLQFHPEVSHTRQGLRIIERFVLDICGCKRVWTTQNIIEESIKKIQEKVGKDNVILGLSGGVDSSVVAALLHRAIGPQLICILIDTGLMRHHEAKEVQILFAKHMGLHLITVHAEDRFFKALSGVTDPEAKRKIIGKLFIDIFEEEASKLKNIKWLAQGTIYPDVIESAGIGAGKARMVKSHHNVGGLPEKMNLKLLEPLRELFKDEVIKMGTELGLPYDVVYRHAFPGAGLAVRILGEVKKEFAETLRRADAILIQELHKHELYYKVSKAFVVFLPIKSVGVLGDARHYDHVVAIRVVETVDYMTAHSARLPHKFLEKVSNRIVNEVPGISRVVYDLSSKPPATIEWE